MAFQFTLEAVLRYRQSLEDRERMALESLLARRTGWRRQLQHDQDGVAHILAATRQNLELEPVPAVEIHFHSARCQGIAQHAKWLQSRLCELEVQILTQRERYHQERRKREVLESLRERQWRDYQLQQSRRQQAVMDELFLLRRALNRPDLPSAAGKACPVTSASKPRGL